MTLLNTCCSRIAYVFSVVGGLVAGATACQPRTSAPELTGTTGTAASQAKMRGPLPDTEIAGAIQRHFQEQGLLRAEHVQVAVTQGVAMLSGSVSNLLAKARAVGVTESIRGVRSVVDQISVAPIARSNEQLESDVKRALQQDVATRYFTIGVAARDGKITLSGAADSWQQKKLFADIAETVPGVKSLDNAVVVHYTVVRDPSEITADVKYRIANDLWLDGDTLRVTVGGQTVHLSGVVGSVAQKSRARSDAWIAGVDSVDDDGVTVDWSAHADQKRVTDYPVTSDAQIAQAVRAAFLVDPRLKAHLPQVTSQDWGRVLLTGTVDSPKARQAAEADARDTVGVWNIRDEILVQPTGKPTDANIESEVKLVLRDDPLLSNGKSIQVSSAKGKVALTGTIASGIEHLDVIADVDSVPGVAEIDDALVVNRPPAEIKARIDDRLFWDPMVDPDLVSVAVAADDVATLTGMVNTWGELKAATDDALAGGAARVINSLKLRNHPEVVPH